MDATDNVIKRINIQDKQVSIITDRTAVLTGMPSVSPDGKCITFAGQENIGKHYDQTKNSIWLINETGVVRLLENKMMQGRAPTWSPDGKWIAFESNRGNSRGLYAVYIIKNDGTSLRRITPFELNQTIPSGHPTGRKYSFHQAPYQIRKKYRI